MQSSLMSLDRNVVTPATAMLFLVSTVTGLMLFVHWQSGLVHAAHEWLSITFAAIAGWHLFRNWRGFIHYLRRSAAVAALATTLALSIVFTATTGSTGTNGGGPGMVLAALADAPLEVAAPVFGMAPDAATARLQTAGFMAAAPGATLDAIAEAAGRRSFDVLAVLAAKGS